MSYRVVIPARYASTRLPGKPLIDLGGQAMIARVARQALAAAADVVVVATDDQRVAAAATASGAQAVLTSAQHASGSDRVMEAVRQQGWNAEEVVVNVQGDEPLVPPQVIDQVAELLLESDADVATLCEPIRSSKDVFDPNVVKLVANDGGRALYFSRAPIPWARAEFGTAAPGNVGGHWWRHVGIYAYRVRTLAEFVSWPPSALEEIEALEQLRFLSQGRSIAVAEAAAPVPGGVDTSADVQRVRQLLGA